MKPNSSSDAGQVALGLAALLALVWLSKHGHALISDVIVYVVMLGTMLTVGGYALRSLMNRQSQEPAVATVLLARSRVRAEFYLGLACLGAALVLNTIVILSLLAHPGQLASQLDAALSGEGDLHTWFGLGLGVFLLGSCLTWFAGFQLRVSASRVEYWSLFGGYQCLGIDEIHKARVAVALRQNVPLRLEILPVHADHRPMLVNLKMFRSFSTGWAPNWSARKGLPGNLGESRRAGRRA